MTDSTPSPVTGAPRGTSWRCEARIAGAGLCNSINLVEDTHCTSCNALRPASSVVGDGGEAHGMSALASHELDVAHYIATLESELRSTRAALEEARARKPLATKRLRVAKRVWDVDDVYSVVPEFQVFGIANGTEVEVTIHAARSAAPEGTDL